MRSMPAAASSRSAVASACATPSSATGTTWKGTPNCAATGASRSWLLTTMPTVATQLARPVANEQVVQAVVLAGHEHGHASQVRTVAHAPRQVEPVPQFRHGGPQGRDPPTGDLEPDALKERAGARVVVLVRLQDVGVVLEEGARHAGDQPRSIRGADEQRQHMIAYGRAIGPGDGAICGGR